MEGAQTSGGEDGAQEQNTEYPAAKNFLAKSSARRDSAVTTQGQDQRSHTEPCRDWDSSTSELPSRNWFGNTLNGRTSSQRKYAKPRN